MSSPIPRVALVTGGARRIGAAIVRELHARGYAIALHCRHSLEEADALAAELGQLRPHSCAVLQADLSDTHALPALVDACVERFGRLDALVNNASGFFPTTLAASTPAQWQQLMAVNAAAPWFLAQAAAPHLARTHGAVVNLMDVYAERPRADLALYAVSKAALGGVTRALAVSLAPDVRVNALALGAILWPDAGIEDATREALIARTPLGRTGTPQEVARAVLWLLDDAPYLTGETIALDGGRARLG